MHGETESSPKWDHRRAWGWLHFFFGNGNEPDASGALTGFVRWILLAPVCSVQSGFPVRSKARPSDGALRAHRQLPRNVRQLQKEEGILIESHQIRTNWLLPRRSSVMSQDQFGLTNMVEKSETRASLYLSPQQRWRQASDMPFIYTIMNTVDDLPAQAGHCQPT